jgi:hypothetical protein
MALITLCISRCSCAVSSLSATFFRNRILGALRTGKQAHAATGVSQNFIFEHPSISRLTKAVALLVDPSLAVDSTALSPLEQIREMIARYSANMPYKTTNGRPVDSGHIVLLTGTTGSLGSHILAALLADERVSRVYAFNRGQSAEESSQRQASSFRERRLDVALLSGEKYVSVVGDFTAERFELPQGVYDEV